jgi:hypothetical protein
MEGAAELHKRERSLVWWGAMMPHMKKPPGFHEFTGVEKPARQSPDWQAELAAWESYTARKH